MSFVTAASMRLIEETAFQRGVSAEALMDLAGKGIARRLISQFPISGHAIAYVGKGNNGGDALVALHFLRSEGWKVSIRAAYPEEKWGELPRKKLRDLREDPCDGIDPTHGSPMLLLDGLLGIGGCGPLRPELADLCAEMHLLREQWGAVIAAMDIPSGLNADSGESSGVIADLTLTVGVPKAGLSTRSGIEHSGRIILVPLLDLPQPDSAGLRFFCPESFPSLLKPRGHEFHKGNAGRIALLAGSPGMTGAAVLSAKAALRAGAGLITLHVGKDFLPTLTSSFPPEIMVRVSDNPVSEAFASNADVLVIGPGTGNWSTSSQTKLLENLATDTRPMVLDADALNIIANNDRHDLLASHHLITPHPGEFSRLAPDIDQSDRESAVKSFTKRYPCTLLLKGARTLVGNSGSRICFNPTGHAGMASGGQGDVLSGVAGALLAQNLDLPDAASLAAWLCGAAGERSLRNGPFTTASDILSQLGPAMQDWQQRRR